MWGKIMIPMYRLWLRGLYGPHCPLSLERPLNLITHSLTHCCALVVALKNMFLSNYSQAPFWLAWKKFFWCKTSWFWISILWASWQMVNPVQTNSIHGASDICLMTFIYTVKTLYNTINFCSSTHKRHSIACPKGRGMGCLLWVQKATYCVDLSKLSSIKYLL